MRRAKHTPNTSDNGKKAPLVEQTVNETTPPFLPTFTLCMMGLALKGK